MQLAFPKPAVLALMMCAFPLFVAPSARAEPVKTAEAPMDAGAVALLDKSAKAYAALDKFAQTFQVVSNINGVTPPTPVNGTLQIQKPDRARMEVKMGEAQMLFVTDGATLVTQTEPTSYQKSELTKDNIKTVFGSIPSPATLIMGPLLNGDNPFNAKSDLAWQDVKQVSLDGMSGVSMQLPAKGARKPAVFQVFLDPKTDLVARVELTASVTQKPGDAPLPYSSVTTFKTDDFAFAPTTFQYTPPAGVKLVERPKLYDARLVVGAKPFALTGKTLEGKSLSLDSYKGKVVLLDFWATWCGPCVGELPNVQAAYKTYNSQGFDIVAVSLDADESELREFVKEKALPWPQIFDGKGWEAGDAQAYGIKGIPFTLLIGKDGNIAAVNVRGADLEPAIKAALAK